MAGDVSRRRFVRNRVVVVVFMLYRSSPRHHAAAVTCATLRKCESSISYLRAVDAERRVRLAFVLELALLERVQQALHRVPLQLLELVLVKQTVSYTPVEQ